MNTEGSAISPQREDRPEVGVVRDDSEACASGDLEDSVVGRGLHAKVPHVQGVAYGFNKLLGDYRRERVIYEEPQDRERGLKQAGSPAP